MIFLYEEINDRDKAALAQFLSFAVTLFIFGFIWDTHRKIYEIIIFVLTTVNNIVTILNAFQKDEFNYSSELAL